MNTLQIQQALYRLGYDPQGCDGTDGPHTEAAKAAFMSAMGITDPAGFEQALQDASAHLLPFIEAKNFGPRLASRKITLIVFHTMEAPEKPKTARNVATWFAGPSAPQASAHFCVDDAEIIQCVLESDVAWHAPGANSQGIGIEHAGYANQTPEQWDDDYSNKVLDNSARLAAALAKRFSIPLVRLSVDDLKAGKAGFCGHVDITNAFDGGKGHQDPGPNMPWDKYMALVQQYYDAASWPMQVS